MHQGSVHTSLRESVQAVEGQVHFLSQLQVPSCPRLDALSPQNAIQAHLQHASIDPSLSLYLVRLGVPKQSLSTTFLARSSSTRGQPIPYICNFFTSFQRYQLYQNGGKPEA